MTDGKKRYFGLNAGWGGLDHDTKKERSDMDLNKMINGMSVRDQLLSYGDYFRSTDQRYYEITPPHYYKYADAVIEFLRVLDEAEFLIPGFDWKAWIIENQLQGVDKHGSFIERAGIEDLRKLMTAYVRQERFCEGFLADVMKRGWVGKVLERLQALTAE